MHLVLVIQQVDACIEWRPTNQVRMTPMVIPTATAALALVAADE
jgi:hypothetical protein